jgi:hypothetical protein
MFMHHGRAVPAVHACLMQQSDSRGCPAQGRHDEEKTRNGKNGNQI